MTIDIKPATGPFRDARHEAMRLKLSRRGLLGACAGVSLTALAAGRAHARQGVDAHGLSDFFASDRVAAAALSPSGRRVAVLLNIGEGDARRMALDIIDADNPSGERRRTPIGDFDVETLAWANESKVLTRLSIPVTAGGAAPIGRRIASETVTLYSHRMVSFDVDTGQSILLFGNERVRMRESLNLGVVIDYLPEDPDHVLMAAREASQMMALHRVNVNTGEATFVERGGYFTLAWATLDGVPVMRWDATTRGSAINIYVRAPGADEWRHVWRQQASQVADRNFFWVGAAGAPGRALVAARLDGEDVMSVRELDLDTLSYGPPLSSRPGLDVHDALLDSRGRYMASAYQAPRTEYDFVDGQLAAHHRAMNGFFDNECNVRLFNADAAHNRFIIHASGPRDAGSWYLYDKQAAHFEYLGARTLLDSRRLAPAETLTVQTRDGAAIEAYLTRPPSGAPGPIIALVHGGPEARDVYGWDRQAQVLAAQGWWVLQPNFRGSAGFGRAHMEAGWRRWGERMQEDVEDALDHAIRLHGLDAGRVAIMGSSYGGYAALMGVVRRPELYKAAVSICGLGDLGDALSYERRDDESADRFIYGYWRQRIGDPDADAAMIAAASPRLRADEIRCPVLLVHGAEDQIVQVHQSRRMREALERAGKSVDYVELAGYGHADWEDHIEHELMTRYVSFFRNAFAA